MEASDNVEPTVEYDAELLSCGDWLCDMEDADGHGFGDFPVFYDWGNGDRPQFLGMADNRSLTLFSRLLRIGAERQDGVQSPLLANLLLLVDEAIQVAERGWEERQPWDD